MTPYSCELQIAQKVWPEIVSQKIVQQGSDLPRTIRTAIAIGSGCALPVAKLASNLIRDRYGCCVNAATPYEVVHSPVVPDVAVLLSAKGEHKHVLSCFESLQRRGVHTVVITARRSSPLIELASRALGTTTVISTTRTVSDGGFIPVESTLVLADLISKALEK